MSRLSVYFFALAIATFGLLQASHASAADCSYRKVANTMKQRLLVSDSPSATFSIIDRIHPGDFMKVMSQKDGRTVKDSVLGKESKLWYQIEYSKAETVVRGWVNSLYAECVDSCPFVEVYRTDGQTLLIKDAPTKEGKVVSRLHPNYIVRALESTTTGMEIKDSALGESSTTWYKVEFYDNSVVAAKQGWVSGLYTLCSHGRMNSMDGTLRLPVPGRHLSSNESDHLKRGSVNAWDLNAPLGTPVRPIAAGTISYAGCNNAGGYGCWTYIIHDNGLKTIMGHMINGSLKVKNGDRVTADTIVGQVGWTGLTSFGPHTHLEIITSVKVPIKTYFAQEPMVYCPWCNVKN